MMERVKEVPQGGKELAQADRIIIAYGETTGHAHVLESPGAKLIGIDRREITEHYLVLAQEGKLVHEEHSAHTYPPGVYKIHRQFEFEPEKMRRVLD